MFEQRWETFKRLFQDVMQAHRDHLEAVNLRPVFGAVRTIPDGDRFGIELENETIKKTAVVDFRDIKTEAELRDRIEQAIRGLLDS